MTVLFYAGCENSEWRSLLAELGVTNVSLSYVGLSKRVKFARPWTIADHFSAETHVLLDAGGYSFNKADAEVTEEEAMDMATRYMAFVTENIDHVDLVTEFDANILGRDWLQAMREDYYDGIGDKFVPVWMADHGRDELHRTASRYSHIGVLSTALDVSAAPLLNDCITRFGVKLHGLGMTSTELIGAVRWDSVGSTSYLSPSIYGDTILWTGHELKRYPKKYKEQSRKRHRSYIEDQGFDADLILADDRKEVLRLSVWSWQQYIDSLEHRRVLDPFGRGVTNPSGSPEDETGERALDDVDNPRVPSGNDLLLPAVPRSRELKSLPIVGITTTTTTNEAGDEVDEPVMSTTRKSLLVCSNCEIRDVCPEFSPGSECAFEFPAYVSTKNQMRALQDFLIELQTQRVLRMSMIEQLKGGYADANLSAEEDRLQRMINAKRDAEKQGFSLHIEATGNGEAGAISRIFGRSVGDASTALPAPISVEQVMSQSSSKLK